MVLGHSIEDTARTQDVQITHNVTFDSMLLADKTLLGLKNSGFYKPSPIQLHGIPLGKCGFDLLLEAKSGTGKTAVFTVIALEKINLSKGLQVVILAPTREIAAQICDVIKQIGSSYKGLRVEAVMGGLPVKDDIAKFQKKVHIVVASPGRLRQLIQEEHVNISTVQLLVLDEADKLITKSFLADTNYIFSVLPEEKQVIMSSATYPEYTKDFIKSYVRNAQHVCPDSNSILLGVAQKVTTVKHNSNIVKQTKLRFNELLRILTQHPFKQCLIFCNYQARIAELHKMLKKEKWPAEQLYGQQQQLDRLDALKSLQEHKCRILISTDLAARGIDASNVDLVINFEPPFDWQTYLHRIGRAGRFGSYGLAITILSDAQEQLKFIKMIAEIKASLNLTNLWDEEKFLIDDESTQNGFSNAASINETVEVHCDSLWKALTSDCNAETNKHKNELKNENIENFEALCNEFNKPEYESFSDLVNSAKNFDAMQTTFEQPVSKLQDIVEHKGTLSNGNTNNIHVNNIQYCNGEKENIEEKVVNKEQSNGSTRYNGILESLPNTEDNYTSEDDDEMTELEQALRNAGLPTAFGSSKYQNKSKNSYLLRNRKIEENSDCSKNTSYLTSNNIPKNNNSVVYNGELINEENYEHCNISKAGPSYEHERQEVESETSECNMGKVGPPYEHERREVESGTSKSSDVDESFLRTNKYLSENQSFNNHKAGQCSSSSHNTDENSNDFGHKFNYQYVKSHGSNSYRKSATSKKENIVKSSKDYHTYMNWYNNLKFRVKQMEFAFYYEEMSKYY